MTFDAQGRETSGSNPTTFSGYGISDSSANFRSSLTDPNGTGTVVFGNTPTLTTAINVGTSTDSGAVNELQNSYTPPFSSGGTNIVVDFQNKQWDLWTSTNMNLIQTTNRPSNATNILEMALRIHAAGGNVIVNSTIATPWRSIGNVTFPVTITNNDFYAFYFTAIGSTETNVFVGINYAH